MHGFHTQAGALRAVWPMQMAGPSSNQQYCRRDKYSWHNQHVLLDWQTAAVHNRLLVVNAGTIMKTGSNVPGHQKHVRSSQNVIRVVCSSPNVI